MILNNRKANNDNVIDEVEEIVYVDEQGNEITDLEEHEVVESDSHVYREGEEFVHEEEKNDRKRTFADLAKSDESKAIFRVKDQVDSLINKGKDI